jgi:hypothetical protein
MIKFLHSAAYINEMPHLGVVNNGQKKNFELANFLIYSSIFKLPSNFSELQFFNLTAPNTSSGC